MDLETVKEHFKNAKEIKFLYGSGNYKFTKAVGGFVPETYMDYITNNTIWNKEYGFSEIISYKEEITTPEHYNNENGTLYKDKPKEIKNDPVVSSVMFQLAQRSILGQSKYGTTLAENNKDNFLQHLKEELMDAILYIEKLQSNDN
jgi:hypothetical protein